jgi:replicative DNA helicase
MSSVQLEYFDTATPTTPALLAVRHGRTVPHSLEAEESLLSTILLDGAETLAKCYAAGVGASSFYDLRHALIFEGCEQLHATTNKVAMDTLAAHLRTTRKLDQIGGYSFLTQVSSRIPTTGQTVFFIEKVREQAQLRAAIRLGTALVEECYGFSGGVLVSEHLASTFAKLSSVVSGGNGAQARKWSQVVSDVEKRAIELIDNGHEPEAETIPFPWAVLNQEFKEMRRKELAIIAARPSIGKSSLMRPIVLKPAIEGMNVLVETLEVSPDELAIQMAASASKLQWAKLSTAHHADQRNFVDALKSLALSNLHVFDCDRTLAAITSRAKAIHSVKPLDLLAVDYLGLIDDCEPGRGETKAQAVGRVTKALKRLAMELNCVVILLAQLNRGSVNDGNREPRLSDLRDSGDIEQDADRVIFIHRPDQDRFTEEKQSDIESVADRPSFFQLLIQAKGRNVGTGLANFYFKRETTNFVPIVKVVEPLRSVDKSDLRSQSGSLISGQC